MVRIPRSIRLTDEEYEAVKNLVENLRCNTRGASCTKGSLTNETKSVIREKPENSDIAVLNEILERVNCQPLDRSYRTMLEQAIFLWQYETNKRADPQNAGTPQGLELYKFIDWCKTNRPDWCPDDNNIVNFVDRLRIKT